MRTACSFSIRFRSGRTSDEDGHGASQTIFCVRRNDVTLRTFHGDSLCPQGRLGHLPCSPSEVKQMTATAQTAHDKNGIALALGDEIIFRGPIIEMREGSVLARIETADMGTREQWFHGSWIERSAQ